MKLATDTQYQVHMTLMTFQGHEFRCQGHIRHFPVRSRKPYSSSCTADGAGRFTAVQPDKLDSVASLWS